MFRHVPGYLARVDPDLRIRPSAEDPKYYVLERRVRRQPLTNLGARNGNDFHVQMRDGYLHISHVDPMYLHRPDVMVQTLKTVGADLWESGGAAKFATELEYEEAAAKHTLRMRRYALFKGIGMEAHSILARLEGTRFNNVGLR